MPSSSSSLFRGAPASTSLDDEDKGRSVAFSLGSTGDSLDLADTGRCRVDIFDLDLEDTLWRTDTTIICNESQVPSRFSRWPVRAVVMWDDPGYIFHGHGDFRRRSMSMEVLVISYKFICKVKPCKSAASHVRLDLLLRRNFHPAWILRSVARDVLRWSIARIYIL